MKVDIGEIVKLVEGGKVGEGLKKAGSDVEQLNDVAIFFQKNNPKVSLDFINKLLEIEPDNAVARYNKGVALDSLENYNAAIKCYKEAIELGLDSDNRAKAWNNKGSALQDLGKHKEAIECYEEVIAIDPNDKDAWYNKGYALEQLKKYEEAIKAYDKAIEINPNDESAWNNKGATLSKLERHEEAIKCYVKAHEIKPDYCTAYKNLKNYLERKKDWWEWWQTSKFKKLVGLFLGILAIISTILVLLNDLVCNKNVSNSSVILIGYIMLILLFPEIRRIKIPGLELEKEPLSDHARPK